MDRPFATIPGASPPYTVQIGDPNRIAEFSGIDTVADFRRRDLAAGGEGAPLVPPFHAALFRVPGRPRVVLNIGGIANVTVLADAAVTGFDTGPGNALLDAWVRERRGLPFDRDGAWSAAGHAIASLLERLEQDTYLAERPPKSTGKERYNLDYVRRRLEGSEEDADVQATLAEFTAASVAQAVRSWGQSTEEVVVCGGGRWNVDLMQAFAQAAGPRSRDHHRHLGRRRRHGRSRRLCVARPSVRRAPPRQRARGHRSRWTAGTWRALPRRRRLSAAREHA